MIRKFLFSSGRCSSLSSFDSMQYRKVKPKNRMIGTLYRRRIRKRQDYKKKHHQPSSFLFNLPQPLITDIIAHVAASSLTDFFITKLICKDFNKIPKEEESFIYQKMSLEKFPVVIWRDSEKHSQFFNKCHECKNPEALYRKGVVLYFGGAKLDLAVSDLKEAANSGHMGAYYALGVIYVISNDGLMKHEGVAILGGMKKSKTMRQKVKDYRESLKFIIRYIWKSPLIVKQRPSCCIKQHRKKCGWSIDEIEVEYMCEACFSDIEIESICSLL